MFQNIRLPLRTLQKDQRSNEVGKSPSLSSLFISGMYWVAIGILMALLVLIVPSVMLVRKMKAKHTEMLRVKKLTDDWEVGFPDTDY